MPTRAHGPKRKSHPSYLQLIQEFPLQSITSEKELNEASATIDSLLRLGKLDAGQEMYLDALSDLVWTYESQRVVFERPPTSSLLTYLLETHGVSQGTVARDTGIPQSTLSQIATGKRGFSKAIIAKLAPYFRVSPALFLEG